MFGKMYDRLNWWRRSARVVTVVTICAIGLLMCFGGSSLLAQLARPNPAVTTESSKVCVSNAYCNGLAPGAGGCSPHGIFCWDAGCKANSGCQWQVIWSCNDQQNSTCYLVYNQPSIASGCVGTCTLISYNMCACMCISDPNGVSTWNQPTDCH